VELQTTSTDGKLASSCTKPLFYFLLMPAPGSRQMQTIFECEGSSCTSTLKKKKKK
jgi:hypothetical protein